MKIRLAVPGLDVQTRLEVSNRFGLGSMARPVHPIARSTGRSSGLRQNFTHTFVHAPPCRLPRSTRALKVIEGIESASLHSCGLAVPGLYVQKLAQWHELEVWAALAAAMGF